MKVNLIEKDKSDIYWRPIIYLLLVAILLTGFLYYQFTILQDYRKELESLHQKLNNFLPYRKQYISLKNKITRLNARHSEIEWEKTINELGYTVTAGVLLSELQLKRENIYLKGRTNSRLGLVRFINNLENSPYYSNLNLKETIAESKIIFEIEAVLGKGRDYSNEEVNLP